MNITELIEDKRDRLGRMKFDEENQGVYVFGLLTEWGDSAGVSMKCKDLAFAWNPTPEQREECYQRGITDAEYVARACHAFPLLFEACDALLKLGDECPSVIRNAMYEVVHYDHEYEG